MAWVWVGGLLRVIPGSMSVAFALWFSEVEYLDTNERALQPPLLWSPDISELPAPPF